jgi:hypothetical protein
LSVRERTQTQKNAQMMPVGDHDMPEAQQAWFHGRLAPAEIA